MKELLAIGKAKIQNWLDARITVAGAAMISEAEAMKRKRGEVIGVEWETLDCIELGDAG